MHNDKNITKKIEKSSLKKPSKTTQNINTELSIPPQPVQAPKVVQKKESMSSSVVKEGPKEAQVTHVSN